MGHYVVSRHPQASSEGGQQKQHQTMITQSLSAADDNRCPPSEAPTTSVATVSTPTSARIPETEKTAAWRPPLLRVRLFHSRQLFSGDLQILGGGEETTAYLALDQLGKLRVGSQNSLEQRLWKGA